MTRAWRQVLREDRLAEIVSEIEEEIEQGYEKIEEMKEDGVPTWFDVEAEERRLYLLSQNVWEEAEDRLYEEEVW